MKIKLDSERFKEFLNPTRDLRRQLKVIYDGAACTNCPSDWFFPEMTKGKIPKDSPVWLGLECCSRCAVRQECYDFASEQKCLGVWGGVLFGWAGPTKARAE